MPANIAMNSARILAHGTPRFRQSHLLSSTLPTARAISSGLEFYCVARSVTSQKRYPNSSPSVSATAEIPAGESHPRASLSRTAKPGIADSPGPCSLN